MHPAIGQLEGARDLVAVRRAGVEPVYGPDGHPPAGQEVERSGVRRADDVDHQLLGVDADHLGQAGEPPQGVEVEAGMVVHHASEPAGGWGHGVLRGQRFPTRLRQSVVVGGVTAVGASATVTTGTVPSVGVGVSWTTAGPFPAR